MTRIDTWLTEEGGSVLQMSFSSNNTAGRADIVLAVTEPVGDKSATFHSIASIRFRTLSRGTANVTLDINNSTNSSLGVTDATPALITGVGVQNLTINVN
jgi:hypothetical protein